MDRPAIPEALKREVRQKCGFGCVICGMPIFDYDHMEEWAKVREHKLENLFLLCLKHHGDKTRGRLSKEAVRQYAQAPFNIGNALSSGNDLLIVGNTCEINVGTQTFGWNIESGGHFSAIKYNETTLVGFSAEDGHLLINMMLRDRNGDVVLQIVKGEQKVSTGVWDYTFEGNELSIRSAPRQIVLDMSLTDKGVDIHRALFPMPPVMETEVRRNKPIRVWMNGRIAGEYGENTTKNVLTGIWIEWHG